VINLAGAPIIARWSEKYKKELFDSRIKTTDALVSAMGKLDIKPLVFISTSAVGFYAAGGKHSEKAFTQSSNFLGMLCKSWEESALNANKHEIRTVVFRFGVVLGKGGGALQKMLFPFKLGLGGIIGDGKQGFSWIHLEDLTRATRLAIDNVSLDGIYNMTAPTPVTNLQLTKALGKALNRPTRLPVPEFALRLLYGDGADVLIKGQHVFPQRLYEAGFTFLYPDIDSALKASI
jgi:hypothetical protein